MTIHPSRMSLTSYSDGNHKIPYSEVIINIVWEMMTSLYKLYDIVNC